MTPLAGDRGQLTKRGFAGPVPLLGSHPRPPKNGQTTPRVQKRAPTKEESTRWFNILTTLPDQTFYQMAWAVGNLIQRRWGGKWYVCEVELFGDGMEGKVFGGK